MSTVSLLILVVGTALIYVGAVKLGIVPDLAKIAGIDPEEQ